jgi:hypothetical protein
MKNQKRSSQDADARPLVEAINKRTRAFEPCDKAAFFTDA